MLKSKNTGSAYYYFFHYLNHILEVFHGDREKFKRFQKWYDPSIGTPNFYEAGIVPDGLARIEKNIRSYTRPYKNYQRREDLLQLFYGIGNIIKGTVAIPLAILTSVLSLANACLRAIKDILNIFYENIFKSFSPLVLFVNLATNIFIIPFKLLFVAFNTSFEVLNGLANAFSTILYGAFQVITYPLIIVKFPVRSYLTPKGGQNVKDNIGINNLVNRYHFAKDMTGQAYSEETGIVFENEKITKDEVQKQCTKMILYKFQKAKAKGQAGTDISEDSFREKLGL